MPDIQNIEQTRPDTTTTVAQQLKTVYQRLVGSPKRQALLAAALAGGTTLLAYPYAGKVLGRLLDPLYKLTGAQDPKDVQQYAQRRTRTGILLAALAAAGGAGASLYYTHRHRHGPNFEDWNSFGGKLTKRSSLFTSPVQSLPASYMSSRVIPVQSTKELFKNDPFLSTYSPYAAHMGTAIISAASGNSRKTTLGNVFDSAVDKLDKKYSLSGLASAAARTGVSYAAASMLTSALDNMIGLPKPVQDSLISAGTWAGAISSILQ